MMGRALRECIHQMPVNAKAGALINGRPVGPQHDDGQVLMTFITMHFSPGRREYNFIFMGSPRRTDGRTDGSAKIWISDWRARTDLIMAQLCMAAAENFLSFLTGRRSVH